VRNWFRSRRSVTEYAVRASSVACGVARSKYGLTVSALPPALVVPFGKSSCPPNCVDPDHVAPASSTKVRLVATAGKLDPLGSAKQLASKRTEPLVPGVMENSIKKYVAKDSSP
jgi:hypothetical protein